MWRELAIRICQYAGIYKDSVDQLQAENKSLKHKIDLILQTSVGGYMISILKCDHGCGAYDIYEDKDGFTRLGDPLLYCDGCDRLGCKQCCVKYWGMSIMGTPLCDKCTLPEETKMNHLV